MAPKEEQKALTYTKGVQRHFSAGGVVFKNTGVTSEWLLIQPMGTDRWQLPKGTIDKGEKSQQTAAREVKEETGVDAEIIDKLETLEYFFIQDGQKIFKSVVFYLMRAIGGEAKVDSKWAHEIAGAKWFKFDEVIEKLSFKNEKKILQKANELLASRVE